MTEDGLKGASILVLEDEPLLRRHVVSLLESRGADVSVAGKVAEARQLIRSLPFDLALLDVNLPDGCGTDLLSEKVFSPNTAVVVCTAEGGVKGAVEAIQLGAQDYLVKPFDPGELPLVFHRARHNRQKERLAEHQRKDPRQTGDGFFFGESLAELYRQLEKIVAADRRLGTGLSPVLIQGETGTGKTTIARWLHHHGPRANAPLVEVNCPALPENLAESELFGHERGAFTDAREARMGLFEAAHGGTLFLDELPSLSRALQAKVLKAIEDQRIRRLGGNKEISVDVRIIAATHQNLRLLVEDGGFREDLMHRLDLFRLAIPPLRERNGDIIRLAKHFLAELCGKHRMPERPISAEGKTRLTGHLWPGNVRELAHEMERVVVFEEGNEWAFSSLPRCEDPGTITRTDAVNKDWLNPSFSFPESGFSLETANLRLIQQALEQTGGNVSAAARLLGVSRDHIRYRLKPGKS